MAIQQDPNMLLNDLMETLRQGTTIKTQTPQNSTGDIDFVKRLLGSISQGNQQKNTPSLTQNQKIGADKAIKKVEKWEQNQAELWIMEAAKNGASAEELRSHPEMKGYQPKQKDDTTLQQGNPQGSPQVVPASSPLSMGSVTKEGNIQDTGFLVKLLSLMSGQGLPNAAKTSEQLATADYVKNQKGTSKSNAWLDFSRQMAEPIAQAAMNGDMSGYINADKRTKTAVSAILSENGINVDDLVLGYGAEQKAMGNVKIMEAKVTAGQAAQTLLDSSFDSKTGNYNVPPNMHTELAISVARLLSPSGVIPYEMVQDLRQGTARENASKLAIYFGLDPNQIGGSTQSVINNFAKIIKRETTLAQKNRDNYLKGKTADYIGMEKIGESTQADSSTKKSAWQRLQEMRSGK